MGGSGLDEELVISQVTVTSFEAPMVTESGVAWRLSGGGGSDEGGDELGQRWSTPLNPYF